MSNGFSASQPKHADLVLGSEGAEKSHSLRPFALVSATTVALSGVAAPSVADTALADAVVSDTAVAPALLPANPTLVAPTGLAWGIADEISVEVVSPEEVAKLEAEEKEKAEAEARRVEEERAQAQREEAANRAHEREAIVPPANYSGVLGIGSQYLGTPYVYGGTSPAGFDCSGFVQYVYAQAGKSLPRTAAAQAAVGTVIPASQAQPGDLVYFPAGHIGIYAGNGMIMHAPYPGRSVEVVPLWNQYYQFVRP